MTMVQTPLGWRDHRYFHALRSGVWFYRGLNIA